MNRTAKVGEHSMGELMDALSQLLQSQLTNLATKADFEVMQTELTELRKENTELRKIISELAGDEAELRKRLEHLESNARRKNLVLRGVQTAQNEQPAEVVAKICNEVLGVESPLGILSAKPVGPRSLKVPPLLVELDSAFSVAKILQRTVRLKGTKISISKDYSDCIRKKRRILFKLRYDLLKIGERRKIVVRDDRLVVGERAFTLRNNQILSGDQPATEEICSLFVVYVACLSSS